MELIMTLAEKRREKQWKFERTMLRHLSIKEMEAQVRTWIHPLLPFQFQSYPFLIDQCLDVTIDSYLLGTEYGRFGYYGESVQEARGRCDEELTHLSHSLHAMLAGWLTHSDYASEPLATTCDMMLVTWWERGFEEAQKAYRLRLH
ncbi:DUF2521 family protein [Shouchella shacheensis]|uniref:DUF2521 family protein n=1 Tax=Shouchella shacheensis TaxID=1649580 RepID=UPI0007404393|nr:DUF2521 family protein [Shouchella shacheensis]